MTQHVENEQTAIENVRLIHETGLHARPSVMLTRLAKSFKATVEIADNSSGPWIDAKSIVRVMGLKVPYGTVLFVRAQGSDADSAVHHIKLLILSDFEDKQRTSDDQIVSHG